MAIPPPPETPPDLDWWNQAVPMWVVVLVAIAGLSIGLSVGIALGSSDDADEGSVLQMIESTDE